MNRFISFLTFTSTLLLCVCCATRVLAQTVLPNAKAGQRAEYHQAKLILVHTPDEELFNGIIHPAAALFESYFDTDEAKKEHREYIKAMERNGAKVFTVREILEAAPIDSLRLLAHKSLTYTFNDAGIDSANVEQGRLDLLSRLNKNELIKTILLQPTVHLSKTPSNTFLAGTYIQRPLMNLFFLRDQQITTARGVIICRMNSMQREMEPEITSFCMRQIGITPIHRISGSGAYLEGGDFIPCATVAFMGRGMRTTREAIEQILDNDLLGQDTLVVVNDNLHWQMQMHLDTYFNVIDHDLVTLCSNRLDAKQGDKPFLTVDIYARANGKGKYRMVSKEASFVEYLKSRSMDIIRISGEDELHYANNFLTISARHIMAVGGQSEELAQQFKDKGVTVDWIRLDNLICGYGAAHCMTQVLIRE